MVWSCIVAFFDDGLTQIASVITESCSLVLTVKNVLVEYIKFNDKVCTDLSPKEQFIVEQLKMSSFELHSLLSSKSSTVIDFREVFENLVLMSRSDTKDHPGENSLYVSI